MTINRLLQLPIRAWRLLAAPLLPPTCRFYPSCSAYALEALDSHSWWRALGLILWRLLRCNPFCRGGYDPVPERHAACTCDPQVSPLRKHTRNHPPTRLNGSHG